MKIITKHEDQYNTHVTVTDDNGAEYNYSIGLHRKGISDKPEDCLLDIYRQMYRGADIQLQEKETKLEAWKRWIAEGHTNLEISHEATEQVSPAVYAMTADDAANEDKRKKDRRIDPARVENKPTQIDRRILKPEILEPAKFITGKVIDRLEKVIEKKEWVSTHPPKLAALEELKKATTVDDLKEVLLKLL
jgi:hypothetical protein